jgi:hypothetical protein
VEEEQQSLPPPKEVEVVFFLSFSVWSSSDNDSERNLEDDEDAAMETPEDSPCLEWWEEAEHKAEEEEEDKMLEEQEAQLESFATACKEERTQAAAAQAIRIESSPRGPGRGACHPHRVISARTWTRRMPSAQSHLRADLAAYRTARSFPSEDSPRLR